METIELRQNNYLQGKKIVQISSILNDNKVKIKGNTSQFIVNGKNPCLIPIPLTEEWLVKFGMIKTEKTIPYSYHINGGKDSYKYFRVQFSQFGDGSSGFQALYLNGKFWKRVMYVHELQNVYYSLASIELTLKL